MDPPEALADAINQFKMQDVDLTGLDTSGGVGREEALKNIKLLVQVYSIFINFVNNLTLCFVFHNNVDTNRILGGSTEKFHRYQVYYRCDTYGATTLHQG